MKDCGSVIPHRKVVHLKYPSTCKSSVVSEFTKKDIVVNNSIIYTILYGLQHVSRTNLLE